jgi:hypothetical protein
MRLGIIVAGAALVMLTAGPSAAVNCKQVNKYLQTGRSVKDVSETMVVSEEEVKKCQDEAAAAAKGGDKAGEKAPEGAAK